MSIPATYEELATLLREQRDTIKKILNVDDANMMIPTDGQGLRILVSVPSGSSQKIPKYIDMALQNGKKLKL